MKIDRDKYVTTRKFIAIIIDQPVQFGNIGFENKLFKIIIIIIIIINRLFICPIT